MAKDLVCQFYAYEKAKLWCSSNDGFCPLLVSETNITDYYSLLTYKKKYVYAAMKKAVHTLLISSSELQSTMTSSADWTSAGMPFTFFARARNLQS